MKKLLGASLCVPLLFTLAGCSQSPPADNRLVGTWEGKETPKGGDPEDKFEPVAVTADFKSNGDHILSLAGEPMFKGRWKVEKADNTQVTVNATGRDITRTGSVTEVDGKKVEKWQSKEGPERAVKYMILFETNDRVRLKTSDPEPWEIVLVRRP